MTFGYPLKERTAERASVASRWLIVLSGSCIPGHARWVETETHVSEVKKRNRIRAFRWTGLRIDFRLVGRDAVARDRTTVVLWDRGSGVRRGISRVHLKLKQNSKGRTQILC